MKIESTHTHAPLVSILMTSYNREKYISQAIESVLNSTYENFELIIVDDVSTDNTVKIAQSYKYRDKRVKVFINKENLGDYPNRNKAASYAKGKYLKYVDADDMIYPYGLEQLVYYMEQFPNAGYGLCSLNQNIKRPFPFVLSPVEAYSYHYLQDGLFHKAPLSSIIKRKIFIDSGGFKPERMVGDFEMWHRLSLNYSVVLMPHGIVWYRKHDSQEINDYQSFKNRYREISSEYIAKSGLSQQQIKQIYKKRSSIQMKNRIKKITQYPLRFLKLI